MSNLAFVEAGGMDRGQKINANFFLYKVFRQPFGSWTCAPKSVDVRTQKCVFLRPRWWGETCWPWGIRAQGSGMSAGNPDQKVYVYAVSLPWMELHFSGSLVKIVLSATFLEICGVLRKSAVFCFFLRPPNARISRRRRESAKTPTYKANIWTKIWPPNCRICLVLKHLGSYFVHMFVHIFALYVGGGGKGH